MAGDHKLAGLYQWIQLQIYDGRRRPEGDDNPHGGGDVGLRPEVVERRGLKPEQRKRYFVDVVAWPKEGATVQ